ncbi:MAG: SDR family oxidoreductase [Acidimicrobiia bacterium]|nr:SDR family oxidoreductase [Acidimicrobiia bacterium]
MELFSLTGKVAVVTGGNGGIGLGIARGLAQAGADVAVWARNEAKSADAVEELRALGVRAEAIACDVADEDAVAAATAETVERLGRIDVAVLNAGVAGVGRLPDFPTEEWDRVLDINLRGAFFTLRSLSNQMITQGEGGSVIVIGSIGGILGNSLSPHYSASKAAVMQMAKAFGIQLARYGIRVNSIAPGFVETEMTDPMRNPKFEELMIGVRTPMRRWGQVEDFAGPAVFLASDASSYMTGTTLVVDGGMLIS